MRALLVAAGLSFLGALSLLGVTIYENFFVSPGDLLDESVELDQLRREGHETAMGPGAFTFPSLVINLPSRTSRPRYLTLKVGIVPFEEGGARAFEKFRPQISDIIIGTASEMDPGTLATPTGKILLENRLRKGMNEGLPQKNLVREILFTEFVVQ